MCSTLLKPDDAFEREIKPGEIQIYQVMLAAGDFIQVLLEQRGVNVALRLVAPDGKELTDVDTQKFRQGIERLYWVTDAAGDFRMEVKSLEKDLSGNLSTPARRGADRLEGQTNSVFRR